MRIAILDKDRCKPKDCNYLCIRMCPIVKTGGEAIVVDDETKKPVISEDMCTGCGICVKKCPFEAITIINLPEELGDPVHQFGVNGFRLYNLPVPKKGVVGLVGANGIGKTTALKILSGELKPNLGAEADWSDIMERFRGNEIQNHVEALSEKRIKAVYKPQYVDAIPRHYPGKVKELLEKADERGCYKDIVSRLEIGSSLQKDITELSGGELQRVAITACLSRDADIYLLDEPSSYLDVRERLNVARLIRSLNDRYIMVVEHDLIVLDYLSDYVHVTFGTSGAYGIISNIKGVRVGINEYLGGFLKSENMRFRKEIKFDVKPPKDTVRRETLVEYPEIGKKFDRFTLKVEAGAVYKPNILGILGPNATGKTTFAKILAGELKPDGEELKLNVRISYKPQYIRTSDEPVATLKIKNELVETFRLHNLMDRTLSQLSGGELQRVAIADCLSRDAHVYLLDEPSAYLDIEERLSLSKLLKKFAYDNDTSVMVIDHDILLVDYLSEEMMVFAGTPGVEGHAGKPTNLKRGMNAFLKQMDVTFRRDPESGRPRANKQESVKDREQRSRGEYYYA
ncbi:MAG: ribosome biogenesis/translation initiation ATPase RLI [Candidatus Altiarchaeota archaeon]